MTGEVQCRRLPWDSDFFGVSIGIAEVGRISERDLTTIRDWCREQGLACLYLLADPADAAGLRLLDDFGFDRVDERMTLRRDLASAEELPQPGPGVRAAVPEDRAALCEIARTTHHNTRFYKDGRFPRDRCDALYERWISRSLDGEADRVFVAEWQGQPAGYVTCQLVGGECGRIGLFAVREDARGRGLGENLLRQAVAWFASKGVATVSVVTQGSNESAREIYRKQGFRIESNRLWYHCWPDLARPRLDQ